MTEGICGKSQSAPKFVTFESPQALRASSPCAQGEPWGVRNFGLFQISRERSKKTEAVFLVGSRRPGGKSKSPRASNCKPAKRLQFEEEESDSEDKRLREQRGLVPARPVLTSLHFLLEKQKKMLNSSCKFLRRVFTLLNVLLTTKFYEFAADFRKIGISCKGRCGLSPTMKCGCACGFAESLSIFASACRDLSGASRQLPLKGEPWECCISGCIIKNTAGTDRGPGGFFRLFEAPAAPCADGGSSG